MDLFYYLGYITGGNGMDKMGVKCPVCKGEGVTQPKGNFIYIDEEGNRIFVRRT